jgi:hypothetical protein
MNILLLTTQRCEFRVVTDKCKKVGFEVLMAVGTKMAVFWVVASCSLVLPDYMALQPRRQPS